MMTASTHINYRGDLKVSSIIMLNVQPMFNIQYSLFCCLELNSLVAHLDNKIKKNESANHYGFQRKSRVESTPSTSNPPQKAPLWTINSESCSRDVVMESSSLTESPIKHCNTVSNSIFTTYSYSVSNIIFTTYSY